MTWFSQSRPAAGLDTTALLLPSDGGRKAERRSHPFAREPLGAGMPERLAGLPDEVLSSVAQACDANLGLAGPGLRRR